MYLVAPEVEGPEVVVVAIPHITALEVAAAVQVSQSSKENLLFLLVLHSQ